jgi:hypothetical protein
MTDFYDYLNFTTSTFLLRQPNTAIFPHLWPAEAKQILSSISLAQSASFIFH